MEERNRNPAASSGNSSHDVSQLSTNQPIATGASVDGRSAIHSETFVQAAHRWFDVGLSVIPVVPGTKQTATKWGLWLAILDHGRLDEHWSRNPGHELGCIVGDGLLVLDADSPESIAALIELERRFGLESRLIMQTRRGQHHYFRRHPGGDDLQLQRPPSSLIVARPGSTGGQVLQISCALRHQYYW